MKRTAPGLLALALGVIGATRAVAGIVDTPLPVLQVGATTLHLYSVPGVINDGLATVFSCTSVDPATITVGVDVFDQDGSLSATGSATVAPGKSANFGTKGVGSLPALTNLFAGDVRGGSARILATSKKVLCTAFVLATSSDPPR